MPRAPRLCARCRALATKGSYCDSCRPAPFDGAKQRWQAQRPANWNRLRRAVIRRSGGLCEVDGCALKGTDVDHVLGVAQDGEWELHNLQHLCEEHHRAKTAREAAEGRKKAQALRRARRR